MEKEKIILPDDEDLKAWLQERLMVHGIMKDSSELRTEEKMESIVIFQILNFLLCNGEAKKKDVWESLNFYDTLSRSFFEVKWLYVSKNLLTFQPAFCGQNLTPL